MRAVRLSLGAMTGRTVARALAACGLLGAGLILWPQVAHAAGALTPPSSHETGEAVRWGFLIALGAEILFVLLLGRTRVLKVIVGVDNRVSTSKTIATVWTFVVAAALLALVYADLLNHPEALEATNAGGRVGQYALLFGGPIGAAILAKAIVSQQVSEPSTAKPPAESPGLADLISNDEGETDLGDLQYVLFNTVALVFVLGTMLIHEPSLGLPHIPDVLLGLTSVAAAGYVGKKLLPPQAVTAELQTTKAKANGAVPIAMTGVTQPKGDEADFWVRFGAEDKGTIFPALVAKGVAVVPAKAAEFPVMPTSPVMVSVTTEGGTVIDAGTFTYEA